MVRSAASVIDVVDMAEGALVKRFMIVAPLHAALKRGKHKYSGNEREGREEDDKEAACHNVAACSACADLVPSGLVAASYVPRREVGS